MGLSFLLQVKVQYFCFILKNFGNLILIYITDMLTLSMLEFGGKHTKLRWSVFKFKSSYEDNNFQSQYVHKNSPWLCKKGDY